jgi:CheY-like chemotaxis protein
MLNAHIQSRTERSPGMKFSVQENSAGWDRTVRLFYGLGERMDNMSYSALAQTGGDDEKHSHSNDLSWESNEEQEGDCRDRENTVLVIDDDEMFLKAVKNHLKRRVAAVYTADSPAAALSILGHYSANVLVCDFDLGRSDINGVELVNLLRKKFSFIKRAVICSGSQSIDIPQSVYIDDVVNKAGELDKLRLLVQKPI